MTTSQYSDLLKKFDSAVEELEPFANQASEKLKLSTAWIGHYLKVEADENAASLLKGSYGCAVEAVSLTALGLLRPAMLSLRSHYELCLQYLFFQDHPRELRSLLDYRSQGPLPSVVKKYLKDHSASFESRFIALSKVRHRTMEDVYGILSGVAHGNALNSISTSSQPTDMIEKPEAVSQSISIFEGVGEIISDHFLSDFQSNWISVPTVVQHDAAARFQGKKPSEELSM